MKQITAYIFEKIKDLPNSVKGLIVFDIDDTILKVDPSQISIYKKEPTEECVAMICRLILVTFIVSLSIRSKEEIPLRANASTL